MRNSNPLLNNLSSMSSPLLSRYLKIWERDLQVLLTEDRGLCLRASQREALEKNITNHRNMIQIIESILASRKSATTHATMSKGHIMRNVLLLAVIGFCSLFTGCGALHNVATTLHNDICVESYNKFVCTNRPASEAPVKAAPKAAPCVGTATRTSQGAIVSTFGSVGTKSCKKLHLNLKIKSLKSKPGAKCSIKNNQEIVCAGFGHVGGLFLILLTLLWGSGLCDLVIANEENKNTRRPFDGMWAACRTMIIAIVGIVIILAAGGAYAAPKTAAHGGCAISSDESTIEIFENSCSPEVLEELIEQVGLECTTKHKMEAAGLSESNAAGGLNEKSDLRLRFIEALCWSEAGFQWTAVWFFLLGLVRSRRNGQGTVGTETLGDWQKREYPAPSLNSWVTSALDPLNTEEVAGYDFKAGQVVEVQKGVFQLDCTVSTISMRDSHTGEICNRFTIVTNDQGRWVRNGFSGYFQKDVV